MEERWPIGVFASIDAGLGVRLDVAHELGVPTIHLHTPSPASRTPQRAAEFLRRLSELGITTTCVFGGFVWSGGHIASLWQPLELLMIGGAALGAFFVGNTMIDTLRRFEAIAEERRSWASLGLPERGYVLATLHRPSNVDDPARLDAYVDAHFRDFDIEFGPEAPPQGGSSKESGMRIGLRWSF